MGERFPHLSPTLPTTPTHPPTFPPNPTTKSQNQDWLSMSENVNQAGPGTPYGNVTPSPGAGSSCGVTGVYSNVFTVTLSMSLMYTDTHTHAYLSLPEV